MPAITEILDPLPECALKQRPLSEVWGAGVNRSYIKRWTSQWPHNIKLLHLHILLLNRWNPLYNWAMAPTNLRLIQALGTKLFTTRGQLLRSTTSAVRAFSADHSETSSVHFRATNTPHPLATKGNTLKATKPTPTISGFDKDGNVEIEVSDR